MHIEHTQDAITVNERHGNFGTRILQCFVGIEHKAFIFANVRHNERLARRRDPANNAFQAHAQAQIAFAPFAAARVCARAKNHIARALIKREYMDVGIIEAFADARDDVEQYFIEVKIRGDLAAHFADRRQLCRALAFDGKETCILNDHCRLRAHRSQVVRMDRKKDAGARTKE